MTSGEPRLIAEHDTWISLDPVLGCPADCGYCYLGSLGLRATKPRLRVEPAAVPALLRAFLYGRRAELMDPAADRTPLCIGNYTDMFMTPRNRRTAVEVLQRIAEALPPRLVVFITKSALDEATVAAIDRVGWPVLWFFSQSFASARKKRLELGGVADFDATIRNAAMVSGTRHQRAAHFWRPFVRELVPPLAERRRIVRRLKESGMSCSVVIGMGRGPGTPLDDPRLRREIPSAVESSAVDGEALDRVSWSSIRKIAKAVHYPLYRHTSCAIALAESQPEQLGTWRADAAPGKCLPCECPLSQRGRCAVRRDRAVDLRHMHAFAREVSNFLGIETEEVVCDVENRTIRIDADITEFDYNSIMHAGQGRYALVAGSIGAQKAWQGSFANMYASRRE